jgi:hypothetical protein
MVAELKQDETISKNVLVMKALMEFNWLSNETANDVAEKIAVISSVKTMIRLYKQRLASLEGTKNFSGEKEKFIAKIVELEKELMKLIAIIDGI